MSKIEALAYTDKVAHGAHKLSKFYPGVLCQSTLDTIISILYPHYIITGSDEEGRLLEKSKARIEKILRENASQQGNGLTYLQLVVHGYTPGSTPNYVPRPTDIWPIMSITNKVIVWWLAAHIVLRCPNESLTESISDLWPLLADASGDLLITLLNQEESSCAESMSDRANLLMRVRHYMNCNVKQTLGAYLNDHKRLPVLPSERGIKLKWEHDPTRGFKTIISSKIDRQNAKRLNRLFPPTSNLDRAHYTMMIGMFVYNLLNGKWRQRASEGGLVGGNAVDITTHINTVLTMVGILAPPQLVIAALLVEYDRTGPSAIRYMMTERGLKWYPRNIQMAGLKEQSACIRRFCMLPDGQVLTPAQVTSNAYWELFYGRSDMVSDIRAEYGNRCTATYHLHAPEDEWEDVGWREPDAAFTKYGPSFYNRLRGRLNKMVGLIAGAEPVKESYEEFLLRRGEWMATGSASGPDAKAETSTGEIIKLNKRGWAERVPAATIYEHLYNSVPEERASYAEKFENGKARALYAVECYHYMHSTYCCRGFEENLYKVEGLEKGLSGLEMTIRLLQRCTLSADERQHLSMIDYADFNRQHTPQAQAMIFEQFASWGRQVGSHPDWIKAHEWLAAAKFNMVATVPRAADYSLPVQWNVKQGMFSGTKGTDLINTILNHAYFTIAHDIYREITGQVLQDLYHVHQGDDVWVSTTSPHRMAGVYYVMNAMGLVTQDLKQMFGPGRGEFLRVLYQGGQATGYLLRALANLILKEVQSPAYPGQEEMITSLNDTIYTLARRGLHPAMVQATYDDLIPHWSKIRAGINDKKPMTMPEALLQLPRVKGGLGAPYPYTYVKYEGVLILPPPPVQTIQAPSDIKKRLQTEMTDDWIKHVSSKMPDIQRQINAEALKSTLVEASYAPLIRAKLGSKPMKAHKRRMAEWRDNVAPNIAKVRVVPVHDASKLSSSQLLRSIYDNDSMIQQLDKTYESVLPLKQALENTHLECYLPTVADIPTDEPVHVPQL